MRILTNEIINNEGKEVELAGWVGARRDHGKIIFIDLRDRKGIAQLVFLTKDKELYKKADQLRPEWVIKVRGIVNPRPPKMENPKLETGKVEVLVNDLEILAKAETPPFAIDTDGYEIGEEIRMKYRYIDLRRSRLQRNLKQRSKILKFIRDFFAERDFTEVETPILGKSTPEGARDYLVPARLHSGKFYALPQSPQQYKQLLMVAGLERYFQIAKCFRDEDTRGDRQPEFTQLDIEMSFPTQEEILELIESLFIKIIETLFPEKKILQKPFPRLNYHEVIKQYGSDKPDLRKDKNDPNELAFAFVVNFPMFEWKETEKRWDAVHHPFTMPQVKNREEFRDAFKKDPAKILAYQYDFVLNGFEIAGGSIRIHDKDLLSAVFEVMGHTKKDVEEKFGHLLEAFTLGVPPHGGIACGIDRFLAILFNEPNIREVIAFPKTGDGRDLMMGAPTPVTKEQLKELHIKWTEP